MLPALLLAISLFSLASPSQAEGGASGSFSDPNLDITADSPAFSALRRTQTRGGALFYDQAFPQSSQDLRAYLEHAPLSAYDSGYLMERYPFAGGELLRWSDPVRGNSFLASPLLEVGTSGGADGDTDGTDAYFGMGARIYGQVFHHLVYYTHATVYSEKVDRARFTHQYNPELGETYSVEKGLGDSLLDFRTYNRFEYYLKFDQDWWSIKAGRDRIHMGPGYFSSLTAARNTPPYYLVEGRIDFAPWLKLDDYLIKMTDTDYDVNKYANIHRLEFKPTASLALAYQDIVIYQDRDPDPAYLLPLVPLTFSEANSGGRDNAAMSFDAIYASRFGVSLWGELFLDDLLGPTSFFDDFWENRWAGLAGFQWALPMAWADADLVTEYSHIEPWTYNGREAYTSFKHYNVPSASKLGPDSRSVDVQASWRPWKRLQLRERWEWNEQGTGRPGTLGVIHDDAMDGQTKEWLGSGTKSWVQASHELTFFQGRFVEASLWWVQGISGAPGQRFGGAISLGW